MRFFVLLGCLLAVPAFAQRVVVIEIDGDARNKLRDQIESAVREAGQVELVSLKQFKDAAEKKKMRGAAAMTPVGVARASKSLKLDAAVGGELAGNTYKVLIYDRAGQQLWAKDLPTKKGLLSEDFAGKLARAIAAAAEQGAAKNKSAPEPEEQVEEQPGLDLTQTDDTGNRGVVTGRPTPPPEDPNRDTDLDDPNKRAKGEHLAMPYFKVWVGGATTWRNQCLRPGVNSCREYDTAATKPTGISIDFTASVPYLGVSLNADVTPLAGLDSRWVQGIGVNIGLQYGQSQTRIVEQTPQGQGPETIVKSDDIGFFAQLFWRIPFHMGVNLAATTWKDGRYGERDSSQPVGWAGPRFGFASRSFLIDPTAGTSLPSSQRTYPTGFGFPVIGADASLPIFHFLRLDVGFSIFINPRPAEEQIVGYGNLNDPTGGATGSGFSLEAGVSGEIWGPIGYIVRWRYQGFTDRYYGQGQKWTVCNEMQCGGVGEESFHSVIWGITASY